MRIRVVISPSIYRPEFVLGGDDNIYRSRRWAWLVAWWHVKTHPHAAARFEEFAEARLVRERTDHGQAT